MMDTSAVVVEIEKALKGHMEDQPWKAECESCGRDVDLDITLDFDMDMIIKVPVCICRGSDK